MVLILVDILLKCLNEFVCDFPLSHLIDFDETVDSYLFLAFRRKVVLV
jgi:hypothetical protein